MIVYNIPQFTGVEFSKDNAGRLLANENIVGIKHTSTNLYSLERIGQAYPEKAPMAMALRWQRAINLRVEACVKVGIFNAMKYGWTLRGVDCGFCRAPFRPLNAEARQSMAELMKLPLEPV